MKKDAAIENLQSQKLKLNTLKNAERIAWQTITSSYIKTIFGEKSEEYKYINNFVFYRQVFIEDVGEQTYQKWTDENKPELRHFIDGCIENIKINGMPKKEWKHILITAHPAIYWSVFSAIVVLAFWLGTKFGK